MFVYCLLVIVVILLIVDRWKPKKFVKIDHQLGNDWKYIPVVGNSLQFIGSNEDFMTTLTQTHMQAWRRKYNAMSGWLGNTFFVVIADADKACTVLKSVLDKHYVHKITKPLVGNGTVFAPVEIWHRRRKILVPTFAPRHVNNFVSIFEAHNKVAADLLQSKVGKGNFSCYDYFSRCSLDSVGETLFGVNINVQRNRSHQFFNALKEVLKIFAYRLVQPLLHCDAIYKLLPMFARQMRAIKTLQEFVDNLIQKKKAQLNGEEENVDQSETADKSNISCKSFLDLMIENSYNSDKVYTDDELREEMLVLALAGTDTSAVALSFTLLLLSQHPDVQDKVYKEIQEVLGDSEKPLHFEDLHNLKYTKAVIKESLRLYPPVPYILRRCNKDLKLAPDLTLPKDCNVLISIWGIQRKPEYWGEDANEFNPDRFMSGQVTTPNAFLAFSHSFRNCVGQQYAMLSITTSLVTILRRYRFKPATNFKYDKSNPLRLSFDIMMKHVNDFTVQIEHRDECKQSIINKVINENK